MFCEKGGFAAVSGVWLRTEAGWPTAVVLAEHSSPGTIGSLTAKAAEAIVPSSIAEVRATATTLFVLLFIPRRPPAPNSLSVQECVRIVEVSSLLQADRSPVYIGVPAGVPEPPLPFGERGDELAAEGGDVGYDAAPDLVGSGRETLEYVPDGLLRRS